MAWQLHKGRSADLLGVKNIVSKICKVEKKRCMLLQFYLCLFFFFRLASTAVNGLQKKATKQVNKKQL